MLGRSTRASSEEKKRREKRLKTQGGVDGKKKKGGEFSHMKAIFFREREGKMEVRRAGQ